MSVGERGEWERTRVPPKFRCSGQVDVGGLRHALHAALGGCLAVGSYGPSPRGVDKGQSKVPGSQPRAYQTPLNTVEELRTEWGTWEWLGQP